MSALLTMSLAVLVLGSLLLASLAPPPSRPIGLGVRGGMLLMGLACYALAAATLSADAMLAGMLALVIASELVCAVGWLQRGDSSGPDEDDGGGGGGGPPKPPPRDWDWDAFEKSFRHYARDHERQPI